MSNRILDAINRDLDRRLSGIDADRHDSLDTDEGFYRSQRYAYSRRLDRHQASVILNLLRRFPNSSIIEIGCSTGVLLESVIAPNSKFSVGTDINAFALSKIRKIPVIQANAEDRAPFASNTFDVVVALHVIEHLRDPQSFLAEAARICRPGGCIFLAYPAEPFRGAFAVWSSLRLFSHPFRVRSIHLHKLRPSDIEKMARGCALMSPSSKFSLRPWPQFFSVIQKPRTQKS